MDSMRRAAVVTGSTGGSGAAICEKLADDGYAIVAHYNSNHDRAQALEERLREKGTTCFTVSADLREPSAFDIIDKCVQQAEAQGLTLHALVNNAGLLLSPSFFETTPDAFDDYIGVNTKAPLFLAQRLVERMSAGGSIVNISSASAHFSSPGDISYAVSKAALESLSINMAEAVGPLGVRVNYVVPGFTDNGHRAFGIEAVREYMSSFSILGDVADPMVVAEAVSFLVSDAAARTTGTGIDVSGGSTIGARGHRDGSVARLLDSLSSDTTGS